MIMLQCKLEPIDEEDIPLLVNGHRLKIYKRSLSKQEFVDDINKIVMVVDQVSAPTSSNH